MIMKTVGFVYILLLLSCTKINSADVPPGKAELQYLALGDSYTIGEGVKTEESFPYQLTARLKNSTRPVALPRVIARTGWTTDELQQAVEKERPSTRFDLVTLLIGVNDQYSGYPINQYRVSFKTLLHQAIVFAGGDPKKVWVLSIPDWGVTPFGKNSGRSATAIAAEIDSFNAVCKEEAATLNVGYIEITTISRRASSDRSLIAADGLHPSAKMYTEWVTLITAAMKDAR